MAQDVAFDSYFHPLLSIASPALLDSEPELKLSSPPVLAASAPPDEFLLERDLNVQFSRRRADSFSPPPKEDVEDVLLSIAARIDADGGLQGKTLELRARLSAAAVLAFLSKGHTLTQGAFRLHVARLLNFLKSLTGLSHEQERIIARTIEEAEQGAAPHSDWIRLARSARTSWKELARALTS